MCWYPPEAVHCEWRGDIILLIEVDITHWLFISAPWPLRQYQLAISTGTPFWTQIKKWAATTQYLRRWVALSEMEWDIHWQASYEYSNSDSAACANQRTFIYNAGSKKQYYFSSRAVNWPHFSYSNGPDLPLPCRTTSLLVTYLRATLLKLSTFPFRIWEPFHSKQLWLSFEPL